MTKFIKLKSQPLGTVVCIPSNCVFATVFYLLGLDADFNKKFITVCVTILTFDYGRH